jgi:Protein of unknown function (DUF1116)
MTADPNAVAYERMVASHPVLIGVRPAHEVVPGMQRNLILHAAPATTWADMSEAMRGGMVGAALFEGLARTPEEAAARAQSGEIVFGAAQDHWAMAGGVGSITASLPVMVIEDRATGNRATHFLMEGLGRTLVAGAFDPAVLRRLFWFRDVLGPVLDQAIRSTGGIDLRVIMAEALAQGDELHNRNRAATGLLLNRLALAMLDNPPPPDEHKRILSFIAATPQFFVGAVLPAAKLMLRAAHAIPGCSVVTAIGANGRSCGLQISGMGNRWFTAPVDVPRGLLQRGYTEADSSPACGDSLSVEAAGLGASVLPTAPALTPMLGLSLDDAMRCSTGAYRIALGEHPHYRIPALGYRGAPVGVDARKVVASGILPVIDIMIGHRTPGVGMVGMGVVSPPMRCFAAAVQALNAGG